MNKEQFILIKLAEECNEIAQRAIKQIQFGANQVQKGTEVKEGVAPPDKEAGLTNLQRLRNELADAAVMCELLQEMHPTFTMEEIDFEPLKAAKIVKLNKYLAFSRSLGLIDGDWTL